MAVPVPSNVNPETFRQRQVNRLLRKAAYLSIFSRPDPSRPNRPIPMPGDPTRLAAVEVNEQLHRFEIRGRCPDSHGVRALNRVGEPVAGVHIRWTVIPDDFEAAPGAVPPPTPLDPMRSQRFAMLDGSMTFRDAAKSRISAFGHGRTFPMMAGGQPALFIGGLVNVLEGYGRLDGLAGSIAVSGRIKPPNELSLALVARFMDPNGRLSTTTRLAPLQPIEDPDPSSTTLTFLGEPDPSRPVTLVTAPDGTVIGSRVAELLRLVEIGFDLGGKRGLRSFTTDSRLVGSLSATLHFNPMDPRPVSPIGTSEGVLSFFDRGRRVIGSISTNMMGGEAHRTELAGAPAPVFRFVGFGPILGGTGCFDGAAGMMSLNAIVSVFPRTLSNLYVLRFHDPAGKMRAALREF